MVEKVPFSSGTFQSNNTKSVLQIRSVSGVFFIVQVWVEIRSIFFFCSMFCNFLAELKEEKLRLLVRSKFATRVIVVGKKLSLT